eukprot:TRINITY_DN1423_c0_g5_i2.p1 TRINITY_DN1423_c0_g5~~TRINITY_DN1423_c0_g5_i2.p1  ORF type:complete len:946 (-),score=193.85 TRINITY_DN1423_c0_g5_i2:647-3484(-)
MKTQPLTHHQPQPQPQPQFQSQPQPASENHSTPRESSNLEWLSVIHKVPGFVIWEPLVISSLQKALQCETHIDAIHRYLKYLYVHMNASNLALDLSSLLLDRPFISLQMLNESELQVLTLTIIQDALSSNNTSDPNSGNFARTYVQAEPEIETVGETESVYMTEDQTLEEVEEIEGGGSVVFPGTAHSLSLVSSTAPTLTSSPTHSTRDLKTSIVDGALFLLGFVPKKGWSETALGVARVLVQKIFPSGPFSLYPFINQDAALSLLRASDPHLIQIGLFHVKLLNLLEELESGGFGLSVESLKMIFSYLDSIPIDRLQQELGKKDFQKTRLCLEHYFSLGVDSGYVLLSNLVAIDPSIHEHVIEDTLDFEIVQELSLVPQRDLMSEPSHLPDIQHSKIKDTNMSPELQQRDLTSLVLEFIVESSTPNTEREEQLRQAGRVLTDVYLTQEISCPWDTLPSLSSFPSPTFINKTKQRVFGDLINGLFKAGFSDSVEDIIEKFVRLGPSSPANNDHLLLDALLSIYHSQSGSRGSGQESVAIACQKWVRGLLFDWIALLHPELSDPLLLSTLFHNHKTGADHSPALTTSLEGDREVVGSFVYLQSLLLDGASWPTLRSCVNWLLNPARSSLIKPTPALNVLTAYVRHPRSWAGFIYEREDQDFTATQFPQGPQAICSVVDFVLYEAASLTSPEKLSGSISHRVETLLLGLLRGKSDTQSIEEVDDETANEEKLQIVVQHLADRHRTGEGQKAGEHLLDILYLNFPGSVRSASLNSSVNLGLSNINSSGYGADVDESAVVPKDQKKSVMDLVLHRLVKLLMDSDSSSAAYEMCRRLAIAHPTLVLRYLSVLEAVLQGRAHVESAKFQTRQYHKLYLYILGILDVLRPFVFQRDELPQLMERYMELLKLQRDHNNKNLLLLVSKLFEFLCHLALHQSSESYLTAYIPLFM